MKNLVVGILAVTLMTGAAFGVQTMVIRDAATGLSAIDIGPAGGTVNVEVWIDLDGATAFKGASTKLVSSNAGVHWNPVEVDGSAMLTYGNGTNGWDQDPGNYAFWVGWLQGSGATPDGYDDGLATPLPGGPLPTPLLSSIRAGTTTVLKGDSLFATVSITIPAGAGTVTIAPSADAYLLTSANAKVIPNFTSLVITPEPISALLLLAGLPMLRRRR